MATNTLDVARLHPNRSQRGAVALRSANADRAGEEASPRSSLAGHPVVRLQHMLGNQRVQRLIQEQRRPASAVSQIARKAPGGGPCSSAPSEEEAVQAQAQQAPVAEDEATVMTKSINRVPLIQRYILVNFPPEKQRKMDAAVPVALDTVEDCDDIGWVKTKAIKDTLRTTIYAYDPDMDLCGWTFPLSKLIKIGPTAFDPSHCCTLESTLAHEASHVSFSTEGGAREMEKDCFGCG